METDDDPRWMEAVILQPRLSRCSLRPRSRKRVSSWPTLRLPGAIMGLKMRNSLVVALTLLTVVASAHGAAGSAPAGQYFFSHPAGNNEFTGGFTLHGGSVSNIGITTGLIACTRPPSTKVQYPGPPNNWQPQKTIPAHRNGANLSFTYSGSFADRINGYPESMQISATITAAGVVAGKVSLQMDDTTAGSGEIKCQTRGFVSFAGKRSS